MLTQYGKLLVSLGLLYLSAVTKGTVVASKKNLPNSEVLLGFTQYYIQRTGKSWFDARKSCESLGYNLISLDSPEKFKAINDYLDNQRDKSQYWTSGNDFLTLDEHYWFPSGKRVLSKYWAPQEPSNFLKKERCDVFRYNQTILLNDLDCTYRRYYICEHTL